jgi:very-short-patch-repair endonuclease
MTEAEIILWARIRRKQINSVQFYRQKPLGKYVVDFYCPDKKLVIEVDGSQHYEEKNIEKDKVREYFLKRTLNLKVIRFNNLDVLENIDGVLEVIYEKTK